MKIKYGNWEVLKNLGHKRSPKNSHIYLLCRCKCGVTKEITLNNLQRNLTTKCRRCSNKQENPLSEHYLRYTYDNMKTRCYNQNNKAYKNYGARGIKICDRWLGKMGFQNFIKDMGDRPEGLTLDRINNNGNYEPVNCRWATYEEQRHNRREPKGEKHPRSKLTNEQVFKIRKLAGIYPQGQIGKMFSVSRETVNAIINKRNWAHI